MKPYPCGLLTGYFGRCILYITNDNMEGEGHNHRKQLFYLKLGLAHPCNVVLEFVCQIDTGETLQSCTFPCLCILYHIVWPCRGANEKTSGAKEQYAFAKNILITHFTWLQAQLQCKKQSNTDFFRLVMTCHLQLMPWKSAFGEQHASILFKGTTFPYGTGPRRETLHQFFRYLKWR